MRALAGLIALTLLTAPLAAQDASPEPGNLDESARPPARPEGEAGEAALPANGSDAGPGDQSGAAIGDAAEPPPEPVRPDERARPPLRPEATPADTPQPSNSGEVDASDQPGAAMAGEAEPPPPEPTLPDESARPPLRAEDASGEADPQNPDPGEVEAIRTVHIGDAEPGAEAEPNHEASAGDGPAEPPRWSTLTGSPVGNVICAGMLRALGAEFTQEPPVTDDQDRDCGIANPLNVENILPGIALEGGAMMRCQTALPLAIWTREIAVPAARHLGGAPQITAIIPGSAYACRPRIGGDSAERLSEHALGNAFDVAGLRLSDGTVHMIEPREGQGDLAEAFQRTIHAGACLFFTTVLGPGSNAAHDDHLHFDVIARSNGWRICQ
ncbi:MAG: extensin family protein [Paracoccus sp. (in: a-proteobacteria)]|nr:extensin family protein [Paracoccus sp. (in: a-proteobacteria)]